MWTAELAGLGKFERLVVPVVRPLDVFGTEITPGLFGANFLATTDLLGPQGTFDDVAASLGVTHLRYPGGSLAEEYFDISDPTRVIAQSVHGDIPVPFLPFDDFMMWAEDHGMDVTIVIPTLTQMGGANTADANGDRFPDVDEDVLRGFIRDTLNGKYGAPDIRAFEIGNEYSGSGEMSSVEYGRLAAEMSVIIRDEIDKHPFADIIGDPDVIVQMGDNFGSASLDEEYRDLKTPEEQLAALEQDYGMEFSPERFLFANGVVSWARVNSALIANEFDTAEESGTVDGIVAHIYGRGLDEPNRWISDYRVIRDVMAENFPGSTKYVTEWNTRSVPFTSEENEIYGLESAQEMLQMMLGMAEYDVEAAHVWPVQQNTANDLSGPEGFTDLTISGEMFRMMSENLPETQAIELQTADPQTGAEVTTGNQFWLFAGESHSSIFVLGGADQSGDVTINLSEVFSDTGTVSIERLGVRDGDNPVARSARPDLEQIDPSKVMSGDTATLDLGALEILHFRFDNPVYTDPVTSLLGEEPPIQETPAPPALFPLPEPVAPEDAVIPPEDSPPVTEHDEGSGFDFGAALGGLLLLPMLLALG